MKAKYTVPHKRKRQGKTNYKKRLELLKGRKHRLVLRKTNTQVIAQVVEYVPKGDKVLLTISAQELKKEGWKHSTKNASAAYLIGSLAAKKAKELKVTEALLDLGLHTPRRGITLYAALKGAQDTGLKIPSSQDVYPSEERISGAHVAHLEKHKDITKDFEKLKSKIQG